MTVVLHRGPRGFGFSLTGGKDTSVGVVTVTHVAADGPAARVIFVGDVVVEINDTKMALPHVAVLEVFRHESAGLTMTVTLDRPQRLDDPYMEVVAEPPLGPPPGRTQSVDTRPYTASRDATGRTSSVSRTVRSPYVAILSREDADDILRDKAIGSFLVRPSTTQPGQFVLAVKAASGVEHVGPLGVPESGLAGLVDNHRRVLDGLPTLLGMCYANAPAGFM